MASLLGIGVTGLNAAQAALLTTSHNISNVNTAGYNRQTTVQGTNTPQFTGAGFIGSGVHVSTVQRVYSEFLGVQAREMQAAYSQLDRYGAQISRINNLLGSTANGLSASLDNFFNAVHEVASHPGDTAARQAMLSSSSTLVARFQMLDTDLRDARKDVNSQISTNVSAINSLASQIADLNERIVAVSSQGTGTQAPNDLLDQRDQLVQDLNKLTRATVVKQDDGSYNVFIGSGQGLVVRDNAYQLRVVDDLEYAEDKQVALDTGTALVRLRSQDLPGGELGGLLAYREQSLNPAQNALGRIGLALAAEFNAQHGRGQDLNGAMGGNYFAIGGPLVFGSANNSAGASATATIANYSQLTTSDYRLRYDGANYTVTRLPEGTAQSFATLPQTIDGVTINAVGMVANDSFLIQPTRNGAAELSVLLHDPNKIAAASPIVTGASLSNVGNGTISAGKVTALPITGNNYEIRFAAGAPMTYTVTNLTTATVVAGGPYTPGASITFDNLQVEVSGSPGNNDVFTVGPNANGTGANANALELAALQTKGVLSGGRATLEGAYGELVASVGNKTREVQSTGKAQQTLLKETEAAREAMSGVNLDEEASNLLRYQQAYQASSKVIAIAGQLFDTILDIMR